MGLSWSDKNYQCNGSSSLNQTTGKLGDTSIHGNKTGKPAQEESNVAPKLEASPSEVGDFFSDSDVSGQLNISSLRPGSLLSSTGGFDRGEFNCNQITDAEANHTLKTVSVEARNMMSGAQVSKKWNLRPHNLKTDRESMYSESHELKLEVETQSELLNAESTLTEHDKHKVGIDAQCELEESVILTDKLMPFSENLSMNFTGSMHTDKQKHELDISQSMLEGFGKKGSPILASEQSNFCEDETRDFTLEHIETSSDDMKVLSSTENIGLQHKRLACELNHGNLTLKPINESEYPKSESLVSTVVDAKDNASNACLGDEEISLPLVDCDSLDLLPETVSVDANLVHLMLPPSDDKNVDLPAPPEKAVIESSGQPEIGEEGTPILSRRRRKSKAETSAVSTRVLRSRSKDKPEAPLPSNVAVEVTDTTDKKRNRKRKQMKKTPVSEFSRTRNHLRYLLKRIKTEQNLIDAYSFEGWRKQSLEKIKPEKELQQAKTHILRYKLKIRYLFQRLDVSLTEGQIPKSLFDSEGEIESEDIFCAKCAANDVSLDNDIILCDGACDRGFHQFCLEPPLQKEDVPQGDEGWLCPGCDCKIDCIDLLNDFNRANLSVLDSWEKIFPEADDTAPGKTLEDGSGLPSDDSEDDDYDPDNIEVDEVLPDQETSSDESNYSASDVSSGSLTKPCSPTKEHYMALPSEDSEDDDFDPDAPDDDEDDQIKEISSSDFSSDSEDMGDILQDYTSTGHDQAKSSRDGELEKGVSVHTQSLKDEMSYLLNSNESLQAAKRNVERLDYKRLHDEIYGNESSDSSDEDFEENVGRQQCKNVSGRKPGKGSVSPGKELLDISPMGGTQEERKSVKQESKQLDTEHGNHFSKSHATSSKARSRKRLGQASSLQAKDELKDGSEMVDRELALGNKSNIAASPGADLGAKLTRTVDVVEPSIAERPGPKSGIPKSRKRKNEKDVLGRLPGKGSASAGNESKSCATSSESRLGKKLGEAATQRLSESFKQNQYPKRPEKENLARDLGLTIQKVSKWFEYARRSSRHSATKILNMTSDPSIGQASSLQEKDKLKDTSEKMVDRELVVGNKSDIAASPGADLGAKPTGTIDVVEQAIAERPVQKSGTPKSRKRKNEKDEQSPSGCEKKLKGISQVDSPDPERVRRSSRLQSRTNTNA